MTPLDAVYEYAVSKKRRDEPAKMSDIARIAGVSASTRHDARGTHRARIEPLSAVGPLQIKANAHHWLHSMRYMYCGTCNAWKLFRTISASCSRGVFAGTAGPCAIRGYARRNYGS